METNKITKRNKTSQNSQTQNKFDDTKAKCKDDNNKKPTKPRYGPLITFPNQRMWSRGIILVGLMVYVWYSSAYNKNEVSFAKQKDSLPLREMMKECDRDYYDEIRKFSGCIPKSCGRFVTDILISVEEANILIEIAQKGMALGGSTGGASILDLHSGALSKGENFVNIYKLGNNKLINSKDLTTYKIVRNKIQHAIAEKFSVDVKSLYLTHPTFFSRLNNNPPKTMHDEYWHAHVDKETYESFHYTSLLYLNDYSSNFKGGRFVFIDKESGSSSAKNITVEPRKGRVLFFTSGAENP